MLQALCMVVNKIKPYVPIRVGWVDGGADTA